VAGQEVSIVGTLEKLEAKKGWKSRIPMTEGWLARQHGRIKCRWFNQPYICQNVRRGRWSKPRAKCRAARASYIWPTRNCKKFRQPRRDCSRGSRKLQKSPRVSCPGEMNARPQLNLFSKLSAPRLVCCLSRESAAYIALWLRHAIKKFYSKTARAGRGPYPRKSCLKNTTSRPCARAGVGASAPKL
jgi:hypothetical protein